MKARWPFLAITCLLLTACQVASIAERSEANKLRDTLNAYEAVVRWGSLDQAYGFLTADLAAQSTVPPGLDNIRVTGYELLSGPRKLSPHKVTQSVAIDYVLQDQQVVRRITDRQIWTYSEAVGKWERANPIPPLQ